MVSATARFIVTVTIKMSDGDKPGVTKKLFSATLVKRFIDIENIQHYSGK